METQEKPRLVAVNHKGKMVCGPCYNLLPEKEREKGTVKEQDVGMNNRTGCSICGCSCWYFYGANTEKFGFTP